MMAWKQEATKPNATHSGHNALSTSPCSKTTSQHEIFLQYLISRLKLDDLQISFHHVSAYDKFLALDKWRLYKKIYDS